MKKLLDKLSHFFSSSSSFNEEEWVLKYQINTMLLFSFFFGLGVFFFSIFRFLEGNYIEALEKNEIKEKSIEVKITQTEANVTI